VIARRSTAATTVTATAGLIARCGCTRLRAVSDAAPTPERLALSREFSEFLVDLSIALHKHAMYPASHPSLDPAAAAVARRARKLLESRERIALGVARNQLIIEGVATDPRQPVLRRLAEGLHRHHLGAVSVTRGIEVAEIASALRALAADAERDGPLGLLPPDRLPAWPHLRLHPLTFDRLALIADAPLAPGASSGKASSRGAELWIGLARVAMAGDTAAIPAAAVPTEPTVVARAIDDHPRAEAYDQVIVGYLLQIARELNEASGAEAAALRRRTGRLIATLKPETLRRLVEMGGDSAQRRAFVLDAAHGMAVDAVLEILKAAADASGQTISHGLVRMLSKLAAHAELGQEHVRPLADVALREQVGRLLDGWQLADPNPEAYGQLLQHVATMGPAARGENGGSQHADQPDPLRVAQMSLEIDASGPLVDRAIDRAIHQGTVNPLLQLLQSLPEGGEAAGETMLARLLQPSAIGTMLAAEPIDFDSLDRLLPFMSAEGHNLLLDALASSGNRTTRRKLLDRLSDPRLDIVPLIVARLDDEQWFVQRNMLVLLTRAGRVPEGFSATPWTTHPDARVRHEAIRLQLTLPAERDLALRAALQDDDPRIVHLGLAALQEGCPPPLAELVVRVATDPKAGEELRVRAVRALGRSRDCSLCLGGLLDLVVSGKTLLGRPRLAPRTPMSLAALRALADGWPGHPQAASVLALARASSDSEIQQAARPGQA
jgi:hypothetical protein